MDDPYEMADSMTEAEVERTIDLGTALRRRLWENDQDRLAGRGCAIRLGCLVKICGDPDLAFAALTMVPRPAWVEEMVGPWVPV